MQAFSLCAVPLLRLSVCLPSPWKQNTHKKSFSALPPDAPICLPALSLLNKSLKRSFGAAPLMRPPPLPTPCPPSFLLLHSCSCKLSRGPHTSQSLFRWGDVSTCICEHCVFRMAHRGFRACSVAWSILWVYFPLSPIPHTFHVHRLPAFWGVASGGLLLAWLLHRLADCLMQVCPSAGGMAVLGCAMDACSFLSSSLRSLFSHSFLPSPCVPWSLVLYVPVPLVLVPWALVP